MLQLIAISLAFLIYTQVTLADQPPAPPHEPYLFHEVESWHKKLGSRYWISLPRKILKDLNNDGTLEMFLLVQGFSRGGMYLVYYYHDSSWIPLSGRIMMSHLPIKILSKSNNGWKDFLTFTPRGNGKKVVETKYSMSAGYFDTSSRIIKWNDENRNNK